jgi:uncharacterized membrane protein
MTDNLIMIDMTLENMDDFTKVVFKMPRWAKWLIPSLIIVVIGLIVISLIQRSKIDTQDEVIRKVTDDHQKVVVENTGLRKIKFPNAA